MKKCLITIVLTGFMIVLRAQNGYWEAAPGPYGGSLTIIPSPTNVVYGMAAANTVFRSDDYGQNWTPYSVTQVDTADYGEEGLLIGASGKFYKTLGYLNNGDYIRKLYVSTDAGQTWVLRNSDLPYFRLYEGPGANLIAADNVNQRILKSSNEGITWQVVHDAGSAYLSISSTLTSTVDGKILITQASDNWFFYSDDFGASWVEGKSPFVFSIPFLAESGTIVALDELGPPLFNLYRSEDQGQNWDTIAFDLGPTGYWSGFTNLNSGRLLLSSNTDLYLSEDDGASWTPLPKSLEQANYFPLNAPLSNGDILGYRNSALFRSANEGASWSYSTHGIQLATTSALKFIDENIQLALTDIGLWKTLDKGISWNRILADTASQTLYSPHPIGYISPDSFAVTMGNALWATIDGGQSFGNISPLGGLARGNVFGASSGYLFCNGSDGILRSNNFGANWQLSIDAAELVEFYEHPSGDLYAFTANQGSSFNGENLWHSQNNGATWVEITNHGLTPTFLRDFYIDNNGNLYITGYHNNALRVAISSDEGLNWTSQIIPDIFSHANVVVNDLGHLFSVSTTPESKILCSVDGGNSWYYLPEHPNDGDTFSELELSPEGQLYVIRFGTMLRSKNSTEYGAYIKGKVALDADQDCSTADAQQGLKNWVIKLEGDLSYFSATNQDGQYAFFADTGFYTIQAVVPQQLWWSVCDSIQEIEATDLSNVDTVNFVALSTANCPLVSVNVAIPLLRRCFENEAFVEYCNIGSEAADSAWVDMQLDPYLSFVGSDQAHIILPDNMIRFFVGDLAGGECGQFQLTVYVDCDSTVLGQTHCILTHGFPDTLCTPTPNWSGANIEASIVCQDTTIELRLKNTGTGNSDFLNFIIIEDDVVLFSGQETYAPNESFSYNYTANGSTWRIESEQEPGHPFSNLALAFTEGCGGFNSLGYINQFPVNGIQPSWHRMCVENTGSFDPNDKQGFPNGVSDAHNIRPGQEIDYLIRFQNTGTDTAFTVMIRDTLSAFLDPTSIRTGAGSHPYTWNINGQGVITFSFNDIMLPDSNVNEPGSHGFIQFKVRPYPAVPLGSVIENKAAIYFDFNLPVITNTTWHTLEKSPLILATRPEPKNPMSHLEIWPNPFQEHTNILLKQKSTGALQLQIYTSNGALITTMPMPGSGLELNTKFLPQGLYWTEIRDEQGRLLASGKMNRL